MTSPQIAQTDILSLITQSGPIAKLVLLSLLAASVFCWTVIATKWRALSRASRQNDKFLDAFWHSKNIDDIYLKSDKYPASPVALIFRSGVKELKKVTSATGEMNNAGTDGVENIYRALARASNTEIATLENHVGWLATIASAAPFVGLFGTVWGIMNAFQGIGASGQASLAVVAPGISEALITTAAGIGAAIPAVIAYNHFGGKIRRLSVDMESFTQDFLNIVQRSILGSRGKGSAQ